MMALEAWHLLLGSSTLSEFGQKCLYLMLTKPLGNPEEALDPSTKLCSWDGSLGG